LNLAPVIDLPRVRRALADLDHAIEEHGPPDPNRTAEYLAELEEEPVSKATSIRLTEEEAARVDRLVDRLPAAFPDVVVAARGGATAGLVVRLAIARGLEALERETGIKPVGAAR
jgi:hypothetical protein